MFEGHCLGCNSAIEVGPMAAGLIKRGYSMGWCMIAQRLAQVVLYKEGVFHPHPSHYVK